MDASVATLRRHAGRVEVLWWCWRRKQREQDTIGGRGGLPRTWKWIVKVNVKADVLCLRINIVVQL